MHLGHAFLSAHTSPPSGTEREPFFPIFPTNIDMSMSLCQTRVKVAKQKRHVRGFPVVVGIILYIYLYLTIQNIREW